MKPSASSDTRREATNSDNSFDEIPIPFQVKTIFIKLDNIDASKKIRKLKTKTYFTKKVLRCHSIPSTLSGSLLKLVDSAHKSTRLSYSHEPRFSASSFGRTSPA